MPNNSCYIQFATPYFSLFNRKYHARKVKVNLHFNVLYCFISKYHINEIQFNLHHGVQFCLFNKYCIYIQLCTTEFQFEIANANL